MKKFISIAVAGVVGAVGFASVASADASFYGRVVAGAVYVDQGTATNDGAWNLGAVDHDGGAAPGSRIGFRGSQDLGSGMEAGFQIERDIRSSSVRNAADTDSTTIQHLGKRHNLAYISGGWGKLTLGNQNNPYMNARHWDQTYFYGGQEGAFYRHEGINYSMSNGPFSLNIMALATNGDEDSVGDEFGDSAMRAAVAATGVAERAAITPGASETSGNDGIDGWIVHAGYDFGVAAVNVAHHADNKDFDITTAATGTAGATAAQVLSRADAAKINNGRVDGNASRDRTAIGFNGSVGALDWYLAYETSDLNAGGNGFEDNDTSSVGGFLGFSASEKDSLYVYHVAHSGDRARYDADGDITLGEDYTETILGYSRDMGPGVRFIAEYQSLDLDLEGSNAGSDPSKLALVVRYVF